MFTWGSLGKSSCFQWYFHVFFLFPCGLSIGAGGRFGFFGHLKVWGVLRFFRFDGWLKPLGFGSLFFLSFTLWIVVLPCGILQICLCFLPRDF